MAIYLVDYENVYIEGLQGLELLTEEDEVHIFYTQNRCGLTFGLYEQLISCRAAVALNEVAVSLKNSDPVKNALDIQLMMYTGYLIGSRQSGTIYIVSKDKDFQLGTEFYQRFLHEETLHLEIIPSIEASFQAEETDEFSEEEVLSQELETLANTRTNYADYVETLRQIAQEPPSFAAVCNQYAKPLSEPITESFTVLMHPEPSAAAAPMFTVQYHNTVRNLLGKSTDEETVNRVCEMISSSNTLVDFNNALARYYHDGQRAKLIYHKFKPRFEDLRHLSKVRSKLQG